MYKNLAKGILAILLLLVAGLLAIGYFFQRASVPVIEGTATVHGIVAQVHIDRDSFGVPHIFAKTDEDAYFGLGYAEAQDRLFQMEMMRRVGEGRLSELVGKKALVVDIWARTIGFSRIAHQLWLHSGTATRKYLTSYVRGINSYIAEHTGEPSFEFDALGIQPEPWNVEQCLMIGRLMSWEMNFSYWTDAAFGDIALSLDSTHLKSLFPDYPAEGATVMEGATEQVIKARWNGNQLNVASSPSVKKDTARAPHARKDSLRIKDSSANNHSHTSEHLSRTTQDLRGFFTELREVDNELSSILGMHGVGGGSNAIAIGSARTTTGGAILENDTHLRLGTPSRWYLAHLKSEEGLNVAGFSIPGLPVILCGRNEKLSWGITNGMADESDFFVESPDSTGAFYHTARGKQKFVEFVDSIRIRDSISTRPMRTIGIEIRQTIHGPIITDHPAHFTQFIYNHPRAGGVPSDTTIFRKKHPIALAWNGEYVLSDEVGAAFKLQRSQSIAEARVSLKSFATPIINVCFAEAGTGAIAWQYVGRLPRRSGNEERVLLPRDGTSAADEWQGFLTMSDMPWMQNPSRGYLVSANNPPMRNRAIAISNNWEPPARADRIAQLVEAERKLDPGSITRISMDVTSPLDRDIILPRLLDLYPDPDPLTTKPDYLWKRKIDSMHFLWKRDSLHTRVELGDSTAKKNSLQDSLMAVASSDTSHPVASYDKLTSMALEYLRNWDGNMQPTETAAAIYAVFLNQLLINTFKDELGPDRFDEFIFVSNIPLRTLERILPDANNVWWDDISTPNIHETRDVILSRSFAEALNVLQKRFGTDMREWQWGKLHGMTYHHQLEAGGATVAKMVNIESGPAAGGLTTVSQASYDLWAPYAMWVGPSMRMIADMKTNVLDAVLPTGNSGAIFGSHYRDMLDLLKAGQYDIIPLDEENPGWKRFELLPAN
jgi:penicillin amidase